MVPPRRRVHALVVEHDDSPAVTEAQWGEHSDAWRWAHLDMAPSRYLRDRALEERELQERLAVGRAAIEVSGGHGGRTGMPHLALEMMVALLVVAAIVIGAAVR
jgi:hypothetical protein